MFFSKLRVIASLLGSFLCFAHTGMADQVKVQILSATVKDKVLEGAELFLQKQGSATVTGKTDTKGQVTITSSLPDDAGTTLIVKKDGYSNAVAKCPCKNMTYALSPTITDLDGLRIVLNWGATPLDLDSHLVFANEQVFFNAKKGDNAHLDVDDTDSYGPETVTITKRNPSEKYVYAIHNYTENKVMGSTTLSNASDAKIFVYVGDTLVRSYYAPKKKVGNLWIVFGIGETGEINDINSVTDVAHTDVKKTLKSVIGSSTFSAPPSIDADSKSIAMDLNKKGELAYHAKKMDEAILLYREAIDLYPDFAQAYSNIGLAFLKTGKNAEAIWSNRKAITLASGATAATVKASSYYNIAKVYENETKWSMALENFEKADSFKKNKAYTAGIARMKEKMK